ncbi:MAG: malate dehydrogenase (quinone) [Saprospiraceae bacterium]|nr:malate dehydrogenase (quinone) [Saprospiraceae bacterium]
MKKIPSTITLIGAGIMSATLGVLIKKLMPSAKIDIYERLDRIGAESSDAWNNAGTGHSAFCELNYTPEMSDGSLNIDKALKIGHWFEVSKQLWAHLAETGKIDTTIPFINDIDHMSFVWGEDNVNFLKKRYGSMTPYALFEDMIYSEDLAQIEEWIPLMMEGREVREPLAVTKMDIGTDVNFGAITRGMIQYLQSCDGVEVHLAHEIQDLTQTKEGPWEIDIKDLDQKRSFSVKSDFVFIGAGGGSLILLAKSDIPEGRGFGGFPVSGQWLRCDNPDIIAKHEAKVYGKASTGSPPMSVPHLDTRMMDGKKALLFGPYAGFSTKFLKNGSYFDLPLSLEVHNIWPMLSAGYKNLDLTKYLVEQVFQSMDERLDFLKLYYPEAKDEDWELAVAGQRVQIIKNDDKKGGVLKFGTEVVKCADGSLAALLGASPGASTSTSIMIDVLNECFPDQMQTTEWKLKMKEMIPTYGKSLVTDGDLMHKTRDRTTQILKLEDHSKTNNL